LCSGTDDAAMGYDVKKGKKMETFLEKQKQGKKPK
jgi:hypothetical protein